MVDTEYKRSMGHDTWLVVLDGALRPIHNFELDQYSEKTGKTAVDGSFETVGWPLPIDSTLSYTTPILVFVNQNRQISVHDAKALVDFVSSGDSMTRYTVSFGGSTVSIESR